MTSPLDQLLAALRSLGTGGTGQVIFALGAAGTIAMAIVQLVKELTPLRSKFQAHWFARWLDRKAATSAMIGACRGQESIRATEVDPVEVELSLVFLATGGERNAFFDMPVEDMTSQLKLCIPIILDEPVSYAPALVLLSLDASDEDLKEIFERQTGQPYFDARARVSRRMERNLDGVRIALGARWKFWMQLASIVATECVVVLAIASSGSSSVTVYVLGLLTGFVGGYFAPVTRDLVAALQQLRKA